jgi:Mg-chelatase subunit ChlD/DNA-directed RNA polymerase specialized sigma24 family protein
METEMPSARVAPSGGSAVPALGAEQREALAYYAGQLLEGAAARAKDVVAAGIARADAGGAGRGERMVESYFAAVRREVFAVLRAEGITQRAAEAETEGGEASLAQRVERLTPKQREAMWLKFSHGFGYDGIASITGLSMRNVGFLLHSALTNLREAMAAEGSGPVAAADDARVTDYVMGEMNDAERTGFEDGLKYDAGGLKAVGEVRALVDELKAGLKHGAGAVGRAKKKRGGTAFWLSGRFYAVIAAAAAIVAAGWWWSRRTAEPATKTATQDAAEFKMRPDAWKLAKARAERDGADVRPGGVSGGGTGASRASGVKPGGKPERVKAKPADVDDQVMAQSAGTGGGAGAPAGKAGAEGSGVQAGGARAESDTPALDDRAVGAGKEGAEPRESGGTGGRKVGDSAEAPAKGTKGQASLASRPGAAAPAQPEAASRGKIAAQRERSSANDKTAAPGGAEKVPSTMPDGGAQAERPAGASSKGAAGLTAALSAQTWPAAAAVSVPALLEDFAADVPVETGGPDLSATVEMADAPWAPERQLVRVVLAAAAKEPRKAAAHVVLLIDVSSSMDAPERLPLVSETARRLLRQLQTEDRVSVVTYAGEARVALPPTPMARAEQIRAVLAGLRPEGMTNGGAGLRKAYEVARAGLVPGGVNRVLLCTDGDFNMGVMSEGELAALVEGEAKRGVELGVFGFGRGRQIDPRLEALAVKGQGGSGSVTTRREAGRLMAAEVNGWRAAVAREVRVEFECDPTQVAACRLVGYETGFLPPETTGRRSVELSEMAPGESVTLLFEVVPAPGAARTPEVKGTRTPGVVLRAGYAAADGQPGMVRVPVAGPVKRFKEASAEFRFTAAVAGLGLALQESPPSREKLASVVRWADDAVGDLGGRDPAGYREEFLTLAVEARELAK